MASFALLHLARMQTPSCDCPPALAATAQAIYGGVAVGTMAAIITLVSGRFTACSARARSGSWRCSVPLRCRSRSRCAGLDHASGSKPIQRLPLGRLAHSGRLLSTVNRPLRIVALNASFGRIARLRGSAPEGPECARKPPFRTECEIAPDRGQMRLSTAALEANEALC